MHLHIIIWQEEQRHNVQSKPDNTISIFMTKGAKSLNLWAPISVIMKQDCRGVQKKWIKCESAKKMVCTVDMQIRSANLLLMIWLCSFRIDTLMRAVLGSIYKGGYNKTRECQSRKKNITWRAMSIVKMLNLKQSIASIYCGMYF